MYVSILLFSAQGNTISRFSGQADVERGFARDKVRLHSCYFSMQNFETTVADQGAVGMLFKGPLLLGVMRLRYVSIIRNSCLSCQIEGKRGSRNLLDKKHPLYYNNCKKMHNL